jgi:pimeloyl-ACP methyl ester carboxylesterase
VRPLPCTVRVDGAEVRFGVRGRGDRDLLLVHGSAAHHGWWHAVVPLLETRWRVIELDLSGHGDSGHRAEHSGRTWADELVAVLQAAGARAPVVAAHSLGGRVALLAAAARPRAFSGLVLLDAGIWPPRHLADRLSGTVPRVRSVRVHPTREVAVARFRLTPEQPAPPPEVLGPVAAASVRAVEGGWTWKHAGQAFPHLYGPEVERAAAGLEIPAAYVSGGASTVVDDVLAERAAALMPRARHVRLPGAHHHLPLEVPGECARVIEELA